MKHQDDADGNGTAPEPTLPLTGSTPPAESEPVQEAVPDERTKAVVLAYAFTFGEVTYLPDATVELPIPVARQLVQTGRARWAMKEE